MRNKTFVNDTVLQKHIRAIHENFWPFICSFLNCNKKFRTGYRLYVHELSHKGIKPFTCGICRKTFTEKGTLKVHLISHSDLTRFHCELCEYRCKSDSQKSFQTRSLAILAYPLWLSHLYIGFWCNQDSPLRQELRTWLLWIPSAVQATQDWFPSWENQ